MDAIQRLRTKAYDTDARPRTKQHKVSVKPQSNQVVVIRPAEPWTMMVRIRAGGRLRLLAVCGVSALLLRLAFYIGGGVIAAGLAFVYCLGDRARG